MNMQNRFNHKSLSRQLHVIPICSGITRDRVLNWRALCTEITEVNLFAFVCNLETVTSQSAPFDNWKWNQQNKNIVIPWPHNKASDWLSHHVLSVIVTWVIFWRIGNQTLPPETLLNVICHNIHWWSMQLHCLYWISKNALVWIYNKRTVSFTTVWIRQDNNIVCCNIFNCHYVLPSKHCRNLMSSVHSDRFSHHAQQFYGIWLYFVCVFTFVVTIGLFLSQTFSSGTFFPSNLKAASRNSNNTIFCQLGGKRI